MAYQRIDIPRHPQWDGPLVLPDGYTPSGDKTCPLCKRPCRTGRRGTTRPGDCPCIYYKRTTTFIDVLQSEYALKAWDRRMVAYGMSQREDLVLAAAACRNDGSDRDRLQEIADAAKEHARASAGANIGTALHTLTEWMDTGQELGHVPEPYPADLRAYEAATKNIEWAAVESFRVHDEWRVGGTADRIGWLNGELHVFDIKTSPNENPISYPHSVAMQLAMYAHSVPYDIGKDRRTTDPAPINLDVAYIISLPAGKGRCEIRPVDIRKGWDACQLAVKVWEWRNTKGLILGDDIAPPSLDADDPLSLEEQAAQANSEDALRELWRQAKRDGALTDSVKRAIMARRTELGKATV